jgi:hypothetical protein
MTIGSFHPGTKRGIFFIIIGSLNTVPFNIFLMVPFGDFHIAFNLNSLTLASSGVLLYLVYYIVAHFIPTLYFLIAFAA